MDETIKNNKEGFISKILNPEVFRYIVFGVLTTIVNYGTFALLSLLFPDDSFKIFIWQIAYYQLANFIAWVVSVAFAFVTNKLFVFKSRGKSVLEVLKELGSFVSVRLVALGIEIFLLWLFIEALDISRIFVLIPIFSIPAQKLGKLAAKVLTTGVNAVVNYVLSKLLVFKTKKEGEN